MVIIHGKRRWPSLGWSICKIFALGHWTLLISLKNIFFSNLSLLSRPIMSIFRITGCYSLIQIQRTILQWFALGNILTTTSWTCTIGGVFEKFDFLWRFGNLIITCHLIGPIVRNKWIFNPLYILFVNVLVLQPIHLIEKITRIFFSNID